MADDKDPNDEYEFADLDVIGSDSADEINSADDLSTRQTGKKNVRRNALTVIAIVVLGMLAYKFLGAFFSGKDKPKSSVPSLKAVTPVPQPAVIPSEPPPVAAAPIPSTQPGPDLSQINQKLSELELSQQSVRSDMNALNNQLSTISSNVNELTEKIADLNQTLTVLASKVDQQSNEIAVLTIKPKPKTVCRVIRRGPILPSYYIQAVIPGRAWLIATNGSTLTVREGTQIAGYGVVKLIDPSEGRVLTTSGKIIRFSQQDS